MFSKDFALEGLEVGAQIPPLHKRPSRTQLVQWAVAAADLNDMHFDEAAAKERGLPGVIVHGHLKTSFMLQAVTRLLGPRGRVTAFSCRFHQTDTENRPLVCRGKVMGKEAIGDEIHFEVEVWIENAKGERTTSGTVAVVYP